MITERSREQTEEKQRKTSKNTKSEKTVKVQKKRFEKKMKKLLTKIKRCDNLIELSQESKAHRTLIIKQQTT